MKCDRYEVLYKIARIANSPDLDFPRSCRGILHFLHHCYQLENLSILLYHPRRRAFPHRLQYPGSGHFEAAAAVGADSPERATLKLRHPVRREDRWFFPVFDGRQGLGVLCLQSAPELPLPEDATEIFRLVCQELARLIRFDRLQGAERQRVRQLTLLSHLGRELNRAASLRDLMPAAVQTIRRFSQAAGVIMRPLYGGAMLGASQTEIDPAHEELLPLFLELEEEYSGRALVGGKPIFRRLPVRGATLQVTEMVIVPLVLQNQVLGVLSVFGDGHESDLSFADSRDTARFFAAIGSQVAHALERVWSRERLEGLSEENDSKLRETILLYRISRAIHSTLRLNELIHLILSSLVAPGGGGFERAMLFTLNERTHTLQGMLCVTRETSTLVLPDADAWDRPVITPEVQQAQREAPCCRQVMKQRLPFDPDDNQLARAVRRGRIIFVNHPVAESGSGAALAEALRLGPYVCAPMLGRERPLGVLLVDNPLSQEPFSPDRRRFLELFAAQAGGAMENSMLLHRLETTHQNLRETQDKLVQGEKMALLGEMAASIAHELRNPLVPIGGFAQRLARMMPADSREQEYTAIIIREVRRMEEMLRNILAFSKKQMLCFGECRLTEVLETALELEKEALARAAILVVKEIAPGLPTIQGDEQKLRQVLINLIANARQVMPDGGTLTLRAYPSTLRGAQAATLEVEDSGGGISPEVLQNMFNPFFTTKETGTGLGLSISHRIVEHHQGEIEVKNRERGVVFIIRLPLHPG
ncbi:MAG: GAF domain-containing protein [Desulfuromonadales bacterium]|nr:GAF domain-containing protein [Desulfuromonadales bacterium]